MGVCVELCSVCVRAAVWPHCAAVLSVCVRLWFMCMHAAECVCCAVCACVVCVRRSLAVVCVYAYVRGAV